jgi:hypothetical protein
MHWQLQPEALSFSPGRKIQMSFETVNGPDQSEFANRISKVISDAEKNGMAIDEAVCIAVAVASDYALHNYGKDYLDFLAKIVLAKKNKPVTGEVIEDSPAVLN